MLSVPASFDRPAAPPRAEAQSGCFVCGPAHSIGLRIKYEVTGGGVIEARWVPGAAWQGFPGIIHGGIVSTVLDEAMSKAVAAHREKALTAEMRVRFRRPVQPGREFVVRGWIVDRWKRRFRTEAAVTGADGEEFAHAWGTFLASITREAEGDLP
jgi:acyl-coenzyme A thioesterase PaaI-like protein